MRFSTALTLPQPPLIAPAIEGLLRRMAGESGEQPEPVQAPQRELPEELDQRVRELGEW